MNTTHIFKWQIIYLFGSPDYLVELRAFIFYLCSNAKWAQVHKDLCFLLNIINVKLNIHKVFSFMFSKRLIQLISRWVNVNPLNTDPYTNNTCVKSVWYGMCILACNKLNKLSTGYHKTCFRPPLKFECTYWF